jgi:monoamine oxidase
MFKTDECQDVHSREPYFASEHRSDEYCGYMNGGAQTGRLAAEGVVSHLIDAYERSWSGTSSGTTQ